MRFVFLIFLHFIILCCPVSSPSSVAGKRSKRGVHSDRSGHGWSYHGDNGPGAWCTYYPVCCGLLQSPINLIGDNSTYVHFNRITLIDYSSPSNLILTNTGHTASIALESGSVIPKITGGNLEDVYQLEAIHMHWGHDSSLGSEHTIDGQAYPLESHFVHYNTKYANFSDAMGHADGLAVFAVFHTIQNKDNKFLKPIVDRLPNVAFAGISRELPEPIVLRHLLPRNLSKFYRYNGSLTTPPCSEVVTWTVFEDTLQVSESQMKEFRGDLHEGYEVEVQDVDDIIHDNHRDPQDGHDRLVQHNVDRWTDANSYDSRILRTFIKQTILLSVQFLFD